MLKIPRARRRLKRSESSDQLFLDFGDGHEHSLQFAPSTENATESVEACFAAACAAEDEGQFAVAADAYRRGLHLGGPHPVLCFNLANVLFALGQHAEAISHFQKAVDLRPVYCEAWNNLGVALAEVGDAQQALLALRRAVLLEPDRAEAQYNLADLLDELGQPAEARQHWRAYLRADAESEWAAHARLKLQSGRSTGEK